MQRLTHYYNGKVAEPRNRSEARDMAEKLAKYEDAEENGVLSLFPFKVGDVAWTICGGMIVPTTVCKIADNGSGWYVFTSSKTAIPISDIFSTPEEAQQARRQNRC